MTALIAWLVLSPVVALLVARCIADDESAPSAPGARPPARGGVDPLPAVGGGERGGFHG